MKHALSLFAFNHLANHALHNTTQSNISHSQFISLKSILILKGNLETGQPYLYFG